MGDFEPSLFPTDQFEICVKFYKKWDKEASHYHKIATEYTVIHSGKFRANDEILEAGDIMVANPGDSIAFECLEDGSNTVVKVPCVKGDKYIDDPL